jgi:hypothetical protein
MAATPTNTKPTSTTNDARLEAGNVQIDNAIKRLEDANIRSALFGIETSIKLAESRAIYQALNRIQ